jgi:hypothetical protein
LTQTLLGTTDEMWCRVRYDACEACCQSFPPSIEQPNPVVASLVFKAAAGIIQAGGVPGCDAARAAAARDAAVRSLDLVGMEKGHPPARPAAGRVPLATVIPRSSRSGGRVSRWAVGVTTAPRRQPTLAPCLESLAAAGWPSPHLFIDGAVTLPDRFASLHCTFHDTKLGAWPSYYLALAELLLRQPESDAYMIIQDDVIVADGGDLRSYLESVLWPGRRPGLVSLYCSSLYTQARPGWSMHRGLWVWGALAFVFPRALAESFVTDARVFGHRRSQLNDGLANIDLVVGRWALRRHVEVWHPTPSLAQHIGDASTLWLANPATGARRADWFAGEPDPREPSARALDGTEQQGRVRPGSPMQGLAMDSSAAPARPGVRTRRLRWSGLVAILLLLVAAAWFAWSRH